MNMVDNILGSGTPPTGESTTPEQAPNDSNRSAEARIHELNAKANAFESELAAIKAQQAQPQTSPDEADSSPQSWGDIPKPRLREIAFEAAKEGNQAYYNAAMEELDRRSTSSAKDEAVNEVNETLRKRQYADQVADFIVNKYGDEAKDPSSKLRQRAEQYYAKAVQEHGKDTVEGIPDIQLMAFSAAYTDLHAGDQDELTRLRDENDRLKSSLNINTGGATFREGRGSQERKDMLRKGDIKSALKESDFIKRLTGG